MLGTSPNTGTVKTSRCHIPPSADYVAWDRNGIMPGGEVGLIFAGIGRSFGAGKGSRVVVITIRLHQSIRSFGDQSTIYNLSVLTVSPDAL
jgi:hypothetical protein